MKKHVKYENASLTVEASFAFPVFFMAVLALCCIFRYLIVEYTVEKSMLSVARNLGQYPDIVSAANEKRDEYANSLLGSIAGKKIPITGLTVSDIAERTSDSLVIGRLFENEIRKYPYACDSVVDGSEGFSCYGSVLFSDDETVLIKCSYKLKAPVSLLDIGTIRKSQELEYRYFTGYGAESQLVEVTEENEEEDDRIVYITEEKVVYHLSLTCPSLNLVITSCAFADVSKKRNKGGGKYYPCERCAKGKRPDNVFISKDGDRYHYKRDCSGLKRTITEIGLKEASKTRRACKRCGKTKQ